jgi:hypothetical protein
MSGALRGGGLERSVRRRHELWRIPEHICRRTSGPCCRPLPVARRSAVQNPLIALLREAELRVLDEQFQPELFLVPAPTPACIASSPAFPRPPVGLSYLYPPNSDIEVSHSAY